MMNYIWAGIMIISIISSFFTGNAENVSAAAVSGAGEGIRLAIELCGIMCFWTGIMEVASKSGIINVISKILSPVTRFLFPKIPQDSKAMKAIIMNMSANILGMSNAATPLGLNAMKELGELSKDKKTASGEMCMFVVLNTASLQLIPATLIAMRAAAGSAAPAQITVPIWICSAAALTVGAAAVKIFEKKEKYDEHDLVFCHTRGNSYNFKRGTYKKGTRL